MSIEKSSSVQHQIHNIGRGQSVGINKASNDNQRQRTSQDLSRDLARKLNRRGCRLRVKRRRGDSNAAYAEKQLAEIERRLERAWEHISNLQLQAMECEHLLALARSDEIGLRKKALR